MKVKTVEVVIKRDVAHTVIKVVPVYEAAVLKAIYGDDVKQGKAGKLMDVESAEAELMRLKGVYRAITDPDTGQPRSPVEMALGTDEEALKAIQAAASGK